MSESVARDGDTLFEGMVSPVGDEEAKRMTGESYAELWCAMKVVIGDNGLPIPLITDAPETQGLTEWENKSYSFQDLRKAFETGVFLGWSKGMDTMGDMCDQMKGEAVALAERSSILMSAHYSSDLR